MRSHRLAPEACGACSLCFERKNGNTIADKNNGKTLCSTLPWNIEKCRQKTWTWNLTELRIDGRLHRSDKNENLLKRSKNIQKRKTSLSQKRHSTKSKRICLEGNVLTIECLAENSKRNWGATASRPVDVVHTLNLHSNWHSIANTISTNLVSYLIFLHRDQSDI